MQSFSAAQTSCGGYGQFRRRWLHGSLGLITPAMSSVTHDTHWKKKEEDAFTVVEGVLLEVEPDALKPVDLQDDHLDSPSISVLSPSPSTPMSDRHSLSANFTTNALLPFGSFVSPLFSPLTPTMAPRTPRTPSSMGYWCRNVRTQPAKLSDRLRPGLLELDLSTYPISPHFPPSTTIPSPFRMQLQEDVATTPLPNGTPLTAKWPGSGFQRFKGFESRTHGSRCFSLTAQ